MIQKIIHHWVPGQSIIKDSGGQPIMNYYETHKDLVEIFDSQNNHLCFRWEVPQDRRRNERRTIQWEKY